MIQEAHISLYAVLLAVGSIQGIFLMMSLLTIRNRRRKANLLLAILMFLFAYDLFDEFLLESGYMLLLPRIAVIDHIADLLYGPVIFFYVLRITAMQHGQSGKAWLGHLIPGMFAACAALFLMITVPHQAFVDFIAGHEAASPNLRTYFSLTTSLGIVSLLTYLLLGLRLLRAHQKIIGDTYSYREAVDLRWLKTVLMSIGGVILVYWTLYLTTIFGFDAPNLLYPLLYFSIIFCIFFLGFKGIRQPELFVDVPPARGPAGAVEAPPEAVLAPGYHGTGIDETQSRLILEELRALLAEDPIYLEPTLTIADLAKTSGFRSHYISQAINQNLQMNFFDFINRYRVEYACRRLEESDDGILGVAMDAGFGSKSSFYTAFRKHTGMTPKQYRARQSSGAH